MVKYRKKMPPVVEAVQWLGFKHGPHDLGIVPFGKATGWLDKDTGGSLVMPGDWIITEADGGKFPVSPRIFEAKYELVVP